MNRIIRKSLESAGFRPIEVRVAPGPNGSESCIVVVFKGEREARLAAERLQPLEHPIARVVVHPREGQWVMFVDVAGEARENPSRTRHQVVLTKGLMLYHGTRAQGFDIPRGPAFFSDDPEIAADYASERRRRGGVPRVLQFRLRKSMRLECFLSAGDALAVAGLAGKKGASLVDVGKVLAQQGSDGFVVQWPEFKDRFVILSEPELVLDVQMDGNPGESLAPRDNPSYLNQLVDEYGFTDDPRLAGFITPDGRFLDLSEGGGSRTADHRGAAYVVKKGSKARRQLDEQGNRWDALVQVLTRSGVMRWMPEQWSVDIFATPTSSQISTLIDLAAMQTLQVSMQSNKHRAELEFGEYDDSSDIRSRIVRSWWEISHGHSAAGIGRREE